MNRINKKIIIPLILLAIIFTAVYSENIQESISHKVIRLHILANSNSPQDQSLKLMVRDRILKEGKEIFKNAKNAAECDTLLSLNMPRLISAAEDEIRKNGYSYNVNISRGRYMFPMKVYENFALPSGEYDAVKVEIGNASGNNWWCVMFPPLCFVDAAVDKTALNTLRQSLTDGEFSLISADDGVNVRFKVVDFFQNSVNRVKTVLEK